MPGIWVKDTITELTQSGFVCLSQLKQGVLCLAADITNRRWLSAELGEMWFIFPQFLWFHVCLHYNPMGVRLA